MRKNKKILKSYAFERVPQVVILNNRAQWDSHKENENPCLADYYPTMLIDLNEDPNLESNGKAKYVPNHPNEGHLHDH